MVWLNHFLLAFIPLMVAIDPVGLVPVYLSLASNVDARAKRDAILQAGATALTVGVSFMFLGQLIFQALGITVGDFRIAGGLILLAIAMQDLVAHDTQSRVATKDFGVVPLGLPLIAGPGMLTTLLTQVQTVRAWITFLALMANIIVVLVALRSSGLLARLVGVTAMRAVSRIVALLLAAIAINLIRTGWRSP